MKALTPKQAALAAKNHNLIYSFLGNRKLPAGEYYDLCAIALCHAAASYDENRGAAFSTWAYRVMRGAVYTAQHRSRKDLTPILSLDAPGKETGTQLGPQLEKGEPADLSRVEAQDSIIRFMNTLPPQERRACQLRLAGKSQREISEALGVGQPWVSRIFQNIRKKYHQANKKEIYGGTREK